MAITITQYPANHEAAWGPIRITGTSNALQTPGRSNLRIKVTITAAGQSVVYYEQTWVGDLGNWAFSTNIAPALRGFLSSPIVSWPGTITPGKAAVTYSVTLQELFDVNGVATLGASNTTSGYVAHRSADISGRIMEVGQTKLSLQETSSLRRLPAGVIFPMGGIATGFSTGGVKIEISKDGGIVDEIFPTITNGRMQFLEELVLMAGIYEFYFARAFDGSVLSEKVKVYFEEKCYKNDLVLYWLNRYGGYEVYHWIDTEVITQEGESATFETIGWDGVPVMRKLPARNTQKMQLIGRMETKQSAAYLKDLITSPEVFDADGNKIHVVSNSMDIYRDGEFRPTITIIKEIQPCIGY